MNSLSHFLSSDNLSVVCIRTATPDSWTRISHEKNNTQLVLPQANVFRHHQAISFPENSSVSTGLVVTLKTTELAAIAATADGRACWRFAETLENVSSVTSEVHGRVRCEDV